MNAFINYLIEANLGLVFFLIIYWLGLKDENQFSAKRFYLLGAIAFSVLFPLLHLNSRSSEEIIPSVSHVVPSYWLPEVVIGDNALGGIAPAESGASAWSWTEIAYGITVLALILLFMFRLASLLRLIWNSKKYLWRYFLVTESNEDKPTFSFFQFIFIGQAGKLSSQEKEIILNHEAVHIRKLHSLDVLLVNLLGIIFWFNPAIKIYKSILIQLHEFEADAKSVEGHELYSYCSLLAKLSLPSAEFSLANHFNNNLTIRRIAMMKTMKKKIQGWKMIPFTLATTLFLFAVACQDQTVQNLSKSTLSQVGHYPANVQAALTKLKSEYPDQSFTYIEGEYGDMQKLVNKDKIGFVKAVFIFQEDGKNSTAGAILSNIANDASQVKLNDEIYTIVEQAATPQGEWKAYQDYIIRNLLYPDSARNAGIEGKVFIGFVVNTDGRLSDFQVLKGIKGGCNEEAIRVLSNGPAWNPAKQNGVGVKQRMVMPITYSLAYGKANSVTVAEPEGKNETMTYSARFDTVNGKVKIEGTVYGRDHKPLAGAHIILKNSTEGVTSGPDGHFQFETTTQQGTLVFSFVGFDSAEYQF